MEAREQQIRREVYSPRMSFMLCEAGAVSFMSAESSVRSRCISTLRAEQEEKGQIPEEPFAYENESDDTADDESILVIIAFAVL